MNCYRLGYMAVFSIRCQILQVMIVQCFWVNRVAKHNPAVFYFSLGPSYNIQFKRYLNYLKSNKGLMYYRFELIKPNPLNLNYLLHLAPEPGAGPLRHVLVKAGGLCHDGKDQGLFGGVRHRINSKSGSGRMRSFWVTRIRIRIWENTESGSFTHKRPL